MMTYKTNSQEPVSVSLKDNSVNMKDVDTCVIDPVLEAAYRVYEQLGYSVVVTSAADGVHSQGSLHKPRNTPANKGGWAVDLRCSKAWGFPKDDRVKITNRMQSILGWKYDVVLEDTHLHVEYDI